MLIFDDLELRLKFVREKLMMQKCLFWMGNAEPKITLCWQQFFREYYLEFHFDYVNIIQIENCNPSDFHHG